MPQSAQGFLLLTLHDVEASLPAIMNAPRVITGNLALECVTLPVSQNEERDVWIVMRIGAYEMPISPTQVIRHDRNTHTFSFISSELSTHVVEWSIRIKDPKGELEGQDLETFEVILAQYAALEDFTGEKSSQHMAASSTTAPSEQTWTDSSLRGRLVLVDEADGKVVGSLGDQYTIKEDDALHARGKEKDPVVIDIPEDGQGRQEVVAHPIDYYEKDFIMKSASLIR